MLDLVIQLMKKSDLDNCLKIFSEDFSKDPWNGYLRFNNFQRFSINSKKT